MRAAQNCARSPHDRHRRSTADDHNLVWIDLEMTGLIPERDRIIEIAVVVTDRAARRSRVEGPVFAVHQSDAALDAMDAWNKGTHGRAA